MCVHVCVCVRVRVCAGAGVRVCGWARARVDGSPRQEATALQASTSGSIASNVTDVQALVSKLLAQFPAPAWETPAGTLGVFVHKKNVSIGLRAVASPRQKDIACVHTQDQPFWLPGPSQPGLPGAMRAL